jgi:hypothetical protein
MNWNNGVVRPTESFKTAYADDQGIKLGAIAFDELGNKYRWALMKSPVDNAGYLLMQTGDLVTAISNITAPNATTDDQSFFTDDTTVTLTKNQATGAYVYVSGATTVTMVNQLQRVRNHAAFTAAAPTIYLDGKFSPAVDATADLSIVKPWYLDLATAAVATSVRGISVAITTAALPYCWVLVNGIGSYLSGVSQTAGNLFTAGGSTDTGLSLVMSYSGTNAAANPIGRTLIAAAAAYATRRYLNLGIIFCEGA